MSDAGNLHDDLKQFLTERGHAMLDMSVDHGMSGEQRFTMSGAMGVGPTKLPVGTGQIYDGIRFVSEALEHGIPIGVGEVKTSPAIAASLTADHSTRIGLWATAFAIAWIVGVSLAVKLGAIG